MPDLPYATIGGCAVLLGCALALFVTLRRAGRRMEAHIENRADQKVAENLGLAATATNTNVINVGAPHGNHPDDGAADYGTTADLIAALYNRGIDVRDFSGVYRAELRQSNNDDNVGPFDNGTDDRMPADCRTTRRIRAVDATHRSVVGHVRGNGDGRSDLRILEERSASVITDVCVPCLDKLGVAVELTQGSCDVCGGTETVEFDLYTGPVV